MFGLCSFSQEFEVRDIQVDSGPTSLQGTFKIIEPVLVLEAEGTPQELYTKTLNWVNETYKNPDEVSGEKNYLDNLGTGYGWILILIGLAIFSIIFYVYYV